MESPQGRGADFVGAGKASIGAVGRDATKCAELVSNYD